MSSKWENIQVVSFTEMPITASTEVENPLLQIRIEGEFSVNDYCYALFDKIMSIGLSEINSFLNYQCHLIKNPILWLNSFEKLIAQNIELFDTKKLQHRHTKFISQIDIKRENILSQKAVTAAAKNNNKKVSCIAGETIFSFEEVQLKLSNINSSIEKKRYLKKVLHEYKQADPEIIYAKVKPFDKQVEAELKYIEEVEELEAKNITNVVNEPAAIYGKNKVQINCNLNQFVDIFYQLHRELFVSGKPIIDGSINDLVAVIVNSFVDKDGREISPDTVKTILTPSKTDKRPKPHKRIDIDKML